MRYLTGGFNNVMGLRSLSGPQARLPSNNFRVTGTGNYGRYINAEFDARLDRYFRTVPMAERIQALGEVIYQIADQVTLVGLFYSVAAGAAADRLTGVSSEWPGPNITWNAHEWDART